MFRALQGGNASMPTASSFPPLPTLPEPPIFDVPYNAKLAAILNRSAFPPTMPAAAVYHAQLTVLNSIIDSLKATARNVSITLLCAWSLMVLTGAVLLVRIRRNRARALQGDVDAARKIVLPAFEPLLWLLCTVNVTLIVTYSLFLVASDYLVVQNRLTVELAVALRQLNGLLIPMYMLEPSLSLRAVRRAFLKTLLLAGYTVPVVLVLDHIVTPDNQRVCYWTLIGARWLVGIYVLYLIAFPPARTSTRSFRLICLYVVTMMGLLVAISETVHQGHMEVTNTVAWVITGYSMVLPVCVWYVLRADTEHWRGIGKRAVELQDTFRRKKGKIDERVSSQGLHVLIEMHRKYIIDFGHLQLREPISEAGEGENAATVYRGFLQTKKMPVAIKVYMPTNFTEETVAEFSHEAALCGALVHPNILKFHGLCVCPPNICLVTELCQGSLQDLNNVKAARLRQQPAMPHQRQQFLIDVGYMIDAARALAYLHSFSPPFAHRDIKPSNFLVDDEGTVKLTDFGASRTLAVRSNSGHQHQSAAAPTAEMAKTLNDEAPQQPSAGRTVLEIPGVVNSLVKHTAQYMAPEVIRAQHAGTTVYGEAADVYSLAMTMWDTLHPGQAKYLLVSANKTTSTFGRTNYGHQCDSEIFELVLAGQRPSVDPHLHKGLAQLIEMAWNGNPRMRPTAQAIVGALESIQEEVCAGFALELMEELNDRGRLGTTASSSATQQTSFAGTQAVEKLRVCEFVESQSEAIRLGSMLMDCGFLHHTKHLRSFEYAGSQYFFDEEHVMLCQPQAIMDLADESGGTSQRDAGKTTSTAHQRAQDLQRQKRRHEQRSVGSSYHGAGGRGHAGSHSVVLEQRCACRKLGQRIETERTTRRRFRRKFNIASHENLLTADLLANDQDHTFSGTGEADFSAFREPSRGRHGRSASEAA